MAVEIIEKNNKQIQNGLKCSLRVGFFEKARYDTDEREYVAQVAFWNEYGTIRDGKIIPPRPFMRNVTDDKSKMERVAQIAKIELEKGLDGEAVAGKIGEVLALMIKQSIQSGDFKPNAPYTIAKKGRSRPLIDTGLMIGSVDFEVKK